MWIRHRPSYRGIHLELDLSPEEAAYFKWLFERVAGGPGFRYLGDDLQNCVMALAAAIPENEEYDRDVREKIRRAHGD